MDNPVSWFILLSIMLVVMGALIKKAEAEKNRYRFENDEFFRKRGRF